MNEREERIMKTPAYEKAMKKKNADSAVHKSNQRTFQAMGEFFKEVGSRNAARGFKKRLFDDTTELLRDCNEFLAFCMEHELIPTWSLFSVWLDTDSSTLNAIISLGEERSAVLQKARNTIYTILEQFTSSGEGNPGGKIFLMKALWGLSDQPTSIDLNVNVNNASRATFEAEQVEKLIELTPKDYTNVEE